MNKENDIIFQAKLCLIALGNAWRYDYSFFNGKILRNQLNIVSEVLDKKINYDNFLKKVGIDKDTLQWNNDE